MTRLSSAKKTSQSTANLGFEAKLRLTADKLRNNMDAAEYFLTRFASAEGKNGGQFYTPYCVVRCLVEMLAPFKGRIYALRGIDADFGPNHAATFRSHLHTERHPVANPHARTTWNPQGLVGLPQGKVRLSPT
jgi:hypothetical protein